MKNKTMRNLTILLLTIVVAGCKIEPPGGTDLLQRYFDLQSIIPVLFCIAALSILLNIILIHKKP